MGITKQLIISMLLVTTAHAADGKRSQRSDSPFPLAAIQALNGTGKDPRKSRSVLSLDELSVGMEKIEQEMGKLAKWAVGNLGKLGDLNDYAGVDGIKGSGSQGPLGGADQALEILWRLVAQQKEQIKNQNARIVALERRAGESHSPPYSSDASLGLHSSCEDWLGSELSNWKRPAPRTEHDDPERAGSLPNFSSRCSSASLSEEESDALSTTERKRCWEKVKVLKTRTGTEE
jgi:hypothetical protein